jgi:hypothetical protein
MIPRSSAPSTRFATGGAFANPSLSALAPSASRTLPTKSTVMGVTATPRPALAPGVKATRAPPASPGLRGKPGNLRISGAGGPA